MRRLWLVRNGDSVPTVLTGYLGAGQTTRKPHLDHEHGEVAVIVNEFGKWGLTISW